MRIIIILALLNILIIGIHAQADFLPGTDDIPLMDGLALPETNDFSFDTPAGQILMFEAQTQHSAEQIREFYNDTLTSLGWAREKQDFYRRDKDTIQLSFPGNGIVRFDITLSAAGES